MEDSYETVCVPTDANLRRLDNWQSLGNDRYLAVRFVAQMSRDENRDNDRLAIVHGPAIDDLTCQAASRREIKTYRVQEVDSRSVSQQVVSRLRAGAVDASIARSILGIATVMHPAISVVEKLASALFASVEKEATRRTVHQAERMVESQSTTEITVPADENRTIFIHPGYYWVTRELYLNYVDFLILDYNGRRGRWMPTEDQPSKRYLKRLGPRGPKSARNEIKAKMHLGTLKYLRRTATDPIYSGETSPKNIVDPSRMEFAWSGAPAYNLPTPTPVKLYEIAKSLR